jgi:hypothetical protein
MSLLRYVQTILKPFMPCSSIQKLLKPTTFTNIIGYLFTLPCQMHFGSMEPSSVAVYLHI